MWESPIETRTVAHSSSGPSGVPWPSRPPGLRETCSGPGAELGAAAGRQGPGFTAEKGSSGSFRLYTSAARHRATSLPFRSCICREGWSALHGVNYTHSSLNAPGVSPRRQVLSNWFVELNWVRLDHFPGPSAANGEEEPCCGIPEEASRHSCTVQPANSSDVWGTNPKPGTGSSGFPSRQGPALPVGDRLRPRAHITSPPPARPPPPWL